MDLGALRDEATELLRALLTVDTSNHVDDLGYATMFHVEVCRSLLT